MSLSMRPLALFTIASVALSLALSQPARANPTFAQAAQMPCTACHMAGQETAAPNAGFTQQGYQVFTSFRGACGYRMDCAIRTGFSPSPPPPAYGPPAYTPPPAYYPPPPGYVPAPAYAPPPPSTPPRPVTNTAPANNAPPPHTSRYFNGKFTLTSRCGSLGITWYWARNAGGGNDQYFTVAPGQPRTVDVARSTIGSFSCTGPRTGYSDAVYPDLFDVY